mmetsp:Transcript_75029/g.160711  ORF Transcript_75029/g.160711 Transcript_75029/m.160711 type:complete len:358 (-) Transcript_75029:122-1195(-)
MDVLQGMAVGMLSTKSAQGTSGLEQLPWLAVAFAIWYVERRREDGVGTGGLPSCGQRLLRRYGPEVAGCAICAALAALLLLRDRESPMLAEDQAWQEIRRQWPLLRTADSLLAIQAMLRLWLLLSAVLRPSDAGGVVDAAPLSGEPALFLFAASACRVALLMFSPGHSLEGPMGGPTNLGFEVAALPILLKLGAGAVRHSPARSLVLVSAMYTAWLVASQHRLPLAEEPYFDTVFTLVQLLELLASVACLVRTATRTKASQGPFAHLAHAVLPLQQGLSLYFFLVAFEDSVEQVSTGRPIFVLCSSGAAQVGMLLLAGALHMATVAAEESEGRQPVETAARATPPEVPSLPLSQILF